MCGGFVISADTDESTWREVDLAGLCVWRVDAPGTEALFGAAALIVPDQVTDE
ncbi:hypothetical protein D3C84_1005970 [compost metagenome]